VLAVLTSSCTCIPFALHHMALGSCVLICARSRGARTCGAAEQAQVEEFTNLALDQGKPQCINQCSLSFILNISLY
jgi:hypothetical protein